MDVSEPDEIRTFKTAAEWTDSRQEPEDSCKGVQTEVQCFYIQRRASHEDRAYFKVNKMMPGENAPPMHPNCRCSVAAYEDSEEYEAWLDFLDNGGSTEEWNRYGRAVWEKTFAKGMILANNAIKSIEKPIESSKIELTDINKMITPYERKVLDEIPKKEGYFDFAAHGSADSIEYGSRDKVLNAREVARIIKHSESYNGEKIRLLSCNTGSTDKGFAQQLANALGVEVEAPTIF